MRPSQRPSAKRTRPSGAARASTQRKRAVRSARHDLVLNLAGVTFVASSGIGLLLAMADEFQQAGNSVRLASVSLAAQSVIQLLNLGEFLSIHPDERSALGESRAA